MAITATETANVDGKGIAPSYQSWTINGALQGTATVTATITVRQPVKGGSWNVGITAGTDTNIVTCAVFPQSVPAASQKAANAIFSGTTTIGAAGDGATTTAYKAFAFPTSGITFPAGTYVVMITANAAETGTIVSGLTLVSMN